MIGPTTSATMAYAIEEHAPDVAGNVVTITVWDRRDEGPGGALEVFRAKQRRFADASTAVFWLKHEAAKHLQAYRTMPRDRLTLQEETLGELIDAYQETGEVRYRDDAMRMLGVLIEKGWWG